MTVGSADAIDPFPDLVARWAAERPDAAAVTGVGRTMSYSELEARANRLARALAGRGVTRDGVVAICLERCADWVVAMLAAMRAGAACMPIGPEDPFARQAGMLRHGGALAVVSTSRLLPVDSGLPRLDLDRLEGELARLEPSRPRVAVPPRGLAYVLFTSGSTGQPKAVGVEHASLANYCAAARRAYGLRADDRVLHISALTHDGSIEEVFLTLACGGTVVLRSDGMLGSAADFLGECGRQRVSVLSLPTAFWHELTQHRDLELWPDLRLVILGGENASAERLARWCEWSRDTVPVINTYGPTEATVIATAVGLDCGGADAGAWLPIGWPVGGAELLVLDDALRRVPPGVVGELFIGGPGLARGYLGDVARTAAAFLPNPFSRAPGARMYRTGDLVRERADGHTMFVGRRDRQLKVRGYRIHLEEVEAALARHPAVGRSAVVVRQNADGTRALAAAAEPKPGRAVTPGELRAHLRRLVPGYMIPARFVVVPRLPALSTGKVDLRRLAEVVEEAASEEVPAVAAANGLVEVATGIIREVLETPVGPDDNFFEAGGYSLMAMRVLSRLHAVAGVHVPIVEFFGEPTGTGLAAAVQRIRANGG